MYEHLFRSGLLGVSPSEFFEPQQKTLLGGELGNADIENWSHAVRIGVIENQTKHTITVPARTPIPALKKLYYRCKEGSAHHMSLVSKLYERGFLVEKSDILANAWRAFVSNATHVSVGNAQFSRKDCLKQLQVDMKQAIANSPDPEFVYHTDLYSRYKDAVPTNTILIYKRMAQGSEFKLVDAYYRTPKGRCCNVYSAIQPFNVSDENGDFITRVPASFLKDSSKRFKSDELIIGADLELVSGVSTREFFNYCNGAYQKSHECIRTLELDHAQVIRKDRYVKESEPELRSIISKLYDTRKQIKDLGLKGHKIFTDLRDRVRDDIKRATAIHKVFDFGVERPRANDEAYLETGGVQQYSSDVYNYGTQLIKHCKENSDIIYNGIVKVYYTHEIAHKSPHAVALGIAHAQALFSNYGYNLARQLSSDLGVDFDNPIRKYLNTDSVNHTAVEADFVGMDKDTAKETVNKWKSIVREAEKAVYAKIEQLEKEVNRFDAARTNISKYEAILETRKKRLASKKPERRKKAEIRLASYEASLKLVGADDTTQEGKKKQQEIENAYLKKSAVHTRALADMQKVREATLSSIRKQTSVKTASDMLNTPIIRKQDKADLRYAYEIPTERQKSLCSYIFKVYAKMETVAQTDIEKLQTLIADDKAELNKVKAMTVKGITGRIKALEQNYKDNCASVNAINEDLAVLAKREKSKDTSVATQAAHESDKLHNARDRKNARLDEINAELTALRKKLKALEIQNAKKDGDKHRDNPKVLKKIAVLTKRIEENNCKVEGTEDVRGLQSEVQECRAVKQFVFDLREAIDELANSGGVAAIPKRQSKQRNYTLPKPIQDVSVNTMSIIQGGKVKRMKKGAIDMKDLGFNVMVDMSNHMAV